MALSALAYVTVADVKLRCGLKSAADAVLDAFLEDLINGVCEAMEKHLCRGIVQRTFTEYRDGTGQPFLYVRNPPIKDDATLAVYVDVDRLYGAETQLDRNGSTSDEFTLGEHDDSIELLGFGSAFPRAPRAVKVVYKGGWLYVAGVSDEIPDAIRLATFLWIQALHGKHGQGKGLLGVTSASASPAGSTSFEAEHVVQSIPPAARKLVAPYVYDAGLDK